MFEKESQFEKEFPSQLVLYCNQILEHLIQFFLDQLNVCVQKLSNIFPMEQIRLLIELNICWIYKLAKFIQQCTLKNLKDHTLVYTYERSISSQIGQRKRRRPVCMTGKCKPFQFHFWSSGRYKIPFPGGFSRLPVLEMPCSFDQTLGGHYR